MRLDIVSIALGGHRLRGIVRDACHVQISQARWIMIGYD
jgi:hypothetical protein